MSRVAIVTDSASDLPPEVAARSGITVVPLVVSFGTESFRPSVTLTTDEFWQRMTAPDAPFPTTAAAAPGDFITAFQAAFDSGADSVVCICVSVDLSGTLKSAQVAFEKNLPAKANRPHPSFGLAELGTDAGIIGAADLAARDLPRS